MLDTNILETFLPLVGHEFMVSDSKGATLAIVLVSADSLAHDKTMLPGATRPPFSLLFRGPLSPVLSQGMFNMEHATLPANIYFFVPVDRKEDGMYYEAVFN